ncbi:MAG: phosphonate C-P lyase system protein PhnH [Pseudomonadota bacterium]
MAQGANAAALAPAFAAPVFDAAYSFRATLTAMSRPGTIVALTAPQTPPAPLGRAMAAVILTLCDLDTPIWFGPSYSQPVAAWCDFHMGAPRFANPREALFVFAPLREAPPLLSLEAGSDAYPDRSATLVIECDELSEGGNHILEGPGIQSTHRLSSDALTPQFLAGWQENGARFPRGVDVILTCGDQLAALPRTTRISEDG